MHVLTEYFVAEKFKKLPGHGDGNAKTNDKHGLEGFAGFVGFEKFEGIKRNNDGESSREEMDNFVKVWSGFIKIKTNAKKE